MFDKRVCVYIAVLSLKFVHSSSEKCRVNRNGLTKNRARKTKEKTYEKVRILSLAMLRARNQLMREGNIEVIDSISEYCLNILIGND